MRLDGLIMKVRLQLTSNRAMHCSIKSFYDTT